MYKNGLLMKIKKDIYTKTGQRNASFENIKPNNTGEVKKGVKNDILADCEMQATINYGKSSSKRKPIVKRQPGKER